MDNCGAVRACTSEESLFCMKYAALLLGWDWHMRELQPAGLQVIGPYRLLGQLGAGGMGQVFLGLSAGGRLVAVKVIRAELAADPEFRARLTACKTGQLQHLGN
jgi:serine/threonine protein kinase